MSYGNDRSALPLPGQFGQASQDAPAEQEDELDDFAPRNARRSPATPEARRAVDTISHFPSREAATDGQLNLKGPKAVLDRFRALCKADRRAYYDMLEILMDHFEQNPRR